MHQFLRKINAFMKLRLHQKQYYFFYVGIKGKRNCKRRFNKIQYLSAFKDLYKC